MHNWPKGKYNGLRIEGFNISISVHLLSWTLRPILRLNNGEPYCLWLCFTARGFLEYETETKSIT